MHILTEFLRDKKEPRRLENVVQCDLYTYFTSDYVVIKSQLSLLTQEKHNV